MLDKRNRGFFLCSSPLLCRSGGGHRGLARPPGGRLPTASHPRGLPGPSRALLRGRADRLPGEHPPGWARLGDEASPRPDHGAPQAPGTHSSVSLPDPTPLRPCRPARPGPRPSHRPRPRPGPRPRPLRRSPRSPSFWIMLRSTSSSSCSLKRSGREGTRRRGCGALTPPARGPHHGTTLSCSAQVPASRPGRTRDSGPGPEGPGCTRGFTRGDPGSRAAWQGPPSASGPPCEMHRVGLLRLIGRGGPEPPSPGPPTPGTPPGTPSPGPPWALSPKPVLIQEVDDVAAVVDRVHVLVQQILLPLPVLGGLQTLCGDSWRQRSPVVPTLLRDAVSPFPKGQDPPEEEKGGPQGMSEQRLNGRRALRAPPGCQPRTQHCPPACPRHGGLAALWQGGGGAARTRAPAQHSAAGTTMPTDS